MTSFAAKSRRTFIKKIAGSTLLATTLPNALVAEPKQGHILQKNVRISANDKIRIACIGNGTRGTDNLKEALKVPGVELAGVADVYDGHLQHARELYGKDLFTTRDYRELLARKDIDAVIIATPDHHHAPMSIAAMQAGKAVYCEKPMIHKLEEGHQIIRAQKETGRVYQVGSQRVSNILYTKAKELYQSGAIGQLNFVEAWWDRFSALGAWQYSIPPNATPANCDFERFLGNAPKKAFDPKRMFQWRLYRDYGNGVAGDLFVHLFSGLHYILGSNGPSRVFATGGLRYWKDGREIPDVLFGTYDYPATATHPAFTLALRVNFVDGSGGSSAFRFVGSEGVMTVENDVTIKRKKLADAPGYRIQTFPEAVQQQYIKEYDAKYPPHKPEMIEPPVQTYKAPEGYSDLKHHFENFFDAMRNGTPVVEDATFGFRAAGPAVLTNKSYFDSQVYGWDADKMILNPNPKR